MSLVCHVCHMSSYVTINKRNNQSQVNRYQYRNLYRKSVAYLQNLIIRFMKIFFSKTGCTFQQLDKSFEFSTYIHHSWDLHVFHYQESKVSQVFTSMVKIPLTNAVETKHSFKFAV